MRKHYRRNNGISVFVKKVAIVVSVVLVCAIGVVVFNHESKEDILARSSLNQEVAEAELKDNTDVKRFVDSLNTETEIILLTEYGTSELDGSKVGNDWLAWITTSDITIHTKYKASMSIATEDINLFYNDNVVYATYTISSINIHAIEILDKHYLKDYGIFSPGFNDSEIIAMEKILVDDIKSSIIGDINNVNKARESLETYLYQLAETTGINLVIR